MNKTSKILAGAALALFMGLNFAATAYALDSLTPVPSDYVPLTTVPGAFKEGVSTNPVQVVAGIYGLAIGIGSIIAVVMIIYAGFEYMYQESIEGKSGAKERITNAFLGLFVILGSYILLKTINPDLVNFQLTLQGGTGKVASLAAYQRAMDLIAQENAASARTLATELQKGQALKSQADKLRGEMQALFQDMAAKDQKDPKYRETPEYKALAAKISDYQSAIDTLDTESATVISQAQASAAEAARASLNKQTLEAVTNGSVQTMENKLQGYQTSLNTEINAINNNPSLTPEQKQTMIDHATQKAAADEQLARWSIDAIKYADDPSKLDGIKTAIRNSYLSITDPKAGNLTDEERKAISEKYVAAQRSIDSISQAQNAKVESQKQTILKCAAYTLAMGTAGIFHCSN